MNKFCILAAGKGTRNNNIVNLHKALLPLENKPVISHIIDRLNSNVNIVVALGYKSDQIKSYLETTHTDRNITFVNVDNYDGPGSGPGYSLLCCKSELQEPFVFTSVDTVIDSNLDIMNINENWIGISSIDTKYALNYCLVEGSKYLDRFYYGSGESAYIGMAGIYEYDKYWAALEERKILKDEYQVIHGFDGLEKIKLINFTWYDTGNNESYDKARKIFNTEVVANKSAEAIFIEKGKVVKYFNNEKTIKTRIDRALYLDGCAPCVKQINNNMYVYNYVEGKLLSEIMDENILNKFFDFYQNKLYRPLKDINFITNCKIMYEDKTKSRLQSLFGSEIDNVSEINGVKTLPIKDLLDKIDWSNFYNKAIPSQFHGDLQPENIIYNDNNDEFILIDWRETFGNSLQVGDVYYDLSKLYHAILINGKSILEEKYHYIINGDKAFIHFYAKSNLIYFMGIFKEFCNKYNYDWYHVELLGILHYLNICTLYNNFQNGEYGKFLFLYGKYLLTKYVEHHG